MHIVCSINSACRASVAARISEVNSKQKLFWRGSLLLVDFYRAGASLIQCPRAQSSAGVVNLSSARFKNIGLKMKPKNTSTRCFFLQYPSKNSSRRGSESDDAFTGCQPQYPDLQGCFNIDSTGLQEVFSTTRHLPDLTRHIHNAYSVIEEFVEGFLNEITSQKKKRAKKFPGRLKMKQPA
jgi:hypothetical protein